MIGLPKTLAAFVVLAAIAPMASAQMAGESAPGEQRTYQEDARPVVETHIRALIFGRLSKETRDRLGYVQIPIPPQASFKFYSHWACHQVCAPFGGPCVESCEPRLTICDSDDPGFCTEI